VCFYPAKRRMLLWYVNTICAYTISKWNTREPA
jgi:hypothetical protein